MQDWIQSTAQGAWLITSNTRLARQCRRHFDCAQREAGRQTWPAPCILSWNAWLDSVWQETVVRSRRRPPLLLSDAAELMIWENRLLRTEDRHPLLRTREAAGVARQAWAYVQQYGIPLTQAAFAGTEESEAFLRWGLRFQELCGEREWLSSACLADYLRQALARREWDPPKGVILTGFDELTPQQQRLLDAMEDSGVSVLQLPFPTQHMRVRRLKFQTREEEFRRCAQWCRAMLEGNPQARISVAAPDLSSCSQELYQVFLETLHPDRLPEGLDPRPSAVHLALGIPLCQMPAAAAALLVLKLSHGTLSAEEASMLLRSPWIRGGCSEHWKRALLDWRLKEEGAAAVSFERLISLAESGSPATPQLAALLKGLRRELDQWPSQQLPSQWAAHFSRLLSGAGWPGDDPPDSASYQAVQHWQALYGELNRLDAVTGQIASRDAYSVLFSLASETIFQVEDEGSPVQISGILEAAVTTTDYLWVLGMVDASWPPTAQPNPFIPYGIQRQYGLPHSSPVQEAERARRWTRRLLACAPEVVVSWRATDEDRDLRPSPLLAQIPEISWEAMKVSEEPGWFSPDRLNAETELLSDWHAPALPCGSHAPGGSRLFQMQAACPFQAFACLRLGADPAPERILGVSPRVRGTLLHAAAEKLWTAIGSKACLDQMAESQLQQAIEFAVDQALADTQGQLQNVSRALQRLERERTASILAKLLELERRRPAFAVLQKEQELGLSIGGLRVTARLDRVDVLDDGAVILLDYKSTAPNISSWSGNRPDEPQLPLYASGQRHRVAGVAFLQLNATEVKFIGLTEHEGLLPEVAAYEPGRFFEAENWQALQAAWIRTLENLAAQFRQGLATPDPKHPKVCEACHLHAFCRIGEIRSAVEQEDGNDA